MMWQHLLSTPSVSLTSRHGRVLSCTCQLICTSHGGNEMLVIFMYCMANNWDRKGVGSTAWAVAEDVPCWCLHHEVGCEGTEAVGTLVGRMAYRGVCGTMVSSWLDHKHCTDCHQLKQDGLWLCAALVDAILVVAEIHEVGYAPLVTVMVAGAQVLPCMVLDWGGLGCDICSMTVHIWDHHCWDWWPAPASAEDGWVESFACSLGHQRLEVGGILVIIILMFPIPWQCVCTIHGTSGFVLQDSRCWTNPTCQDTSIKHQAWHQPHLYSSTDMNMTVVLYSFTTTLAPFVYTR